MESLQHFKLYFKSRSLSTSHVHCLQQNWVPLKSMSLYHHRTSSFRFHTCDLNSWREFIFRTQLWCIKLGRNLTQCLCVAPSNLRGDWGILAVPTLFFRCQGKKGGMLNKQAKNCFVYCLRNSKDGSPLTVQCFFAEELFPKEMCWLQPFSLAW